MKKVVMVFLIISFLCGCAATNTLKAPCNQSGNNCWPRTKINQWDNNE